MLSMCAGSVRYYAAAVAAGHIIIDDDERRLPLRHTHHRYVIDGPNGAQQLTVPVVSATMNMSTPLRDVRIAEHGSWRRLHWGALFSAYGRTPYFDYIAPELETIVMGRQQYLIDFNTQLHTLLVDFMALPVTTSLVSEQPLPTSMQDLRSLTAGKHSDTLPVNDVSYYQAWTMRYGFRGGLSILDMAMNLGRESILVLQRMLPCRPIMVGN